MSVCATCGMPVRTVFVSGKITEVYAVCGHVKKPEKEEGASA